MNRFAEAKEIVERALQQKLDTTFFHSRLYTIAFVEGDRAAMQQQIDWGKGQPDEYVALDWQTGAAAFAGQWRQGQDFARRAIDLATRSNNREVAAQYAAEQALRAAVLWYGTGSGSDLLSRSERTSPANRVATAPRTVLMLAAQSLALGRSRLSLPRATLALALGGESSRVQPLVGELVQRYPKNTFVNEIWLPAIRAAMELERGQAARAIERLQPALRYEAAAEFWPQYVRGLAFLRAQSGRLAAAEFQKILDHRGQAPLSALYPLAHLGLARAAALGGDVAKSRQAYQDFLALWKEADADLPVLMVAKKEYETLK
jgi:hypothetical protein